MSMIKDVMIDFCELSVQRIDGQLRRDVEFEAVMNRLIHVEWLEHATFCWFVKCVRIVERINTTTGERRLRWATKLWNAIDTMEQPEPCWNLMARELPDCFYADGTNCLKFTY